MSAIGGPLLLGIGATLAIIVSRGTMPGLAFLCLVVASWGLLLTFAGTAVLKYRRWGWGLLVIAWLVLPLVAIDIYRDRPSKWKPPQ
jgi:hypothetical protein